MNSLEPHGRSLRRRIAALYVVAALGLSLACGRLMLGRETPAADEQAKRAAAAMNARLTEHLAPLKEKQKAQREAAQAKLREKRKAEGKAKFLNRLLCGATRAIGGTRGRTSSPH